jgi:hypothetical protein
MCARTRLEMDRNGCVFVGRVVQVRVGVVVDEMDGQSNEVDMSADVFRNRIGLAAYCKSDTMYYE